VLNANRANAAAPPKAVQHPNYRPDIDGLRAIAVLSVVFFHGGVPGFGGGFVGVDVFFVISGYLISGLVYDAIQGSRFSLATFYLRRAKRIFPALGLVLICSTVASWFILAPSDFLKLGDSLFSTAFFISNIYFSKNLGYFDGIAFEKPLLHTWSLAIEEQFYIIFPVMLLAASVFLSRRKLTVLLLALAGLSLVVAETMLRQAPDAAFYLLPSRAWELLLGAVLALSSPDVRVSKPVAFMLSCIALAAILASAALFDESISFPGLSAALPCGGAALLILAGRQHRTMIQSALGFRPVVFVGLISYSLYLWHWPIFSLSHYYLNRELSGGEVIVAIGASFVLAMLTWKFVERPVRYSSFGILRPGPAVAIAAVPLMLLGGIGEIIQAAEGFPGRLKTDVAAIYTAGRQRPPLRKACHGVKKALVNDDKCNFGAERRDGSFDMVVWGDSHADHIVPALSEVAQGWGWSGRQISESACAPVWGASVWKKGRILPDCDRFGQVMDEFLRRNSNLKLVVLASRWAAFATDPEHQAPAGSLFLVDGSSSEISFDNSRRVIAQRLSETVARFTSAGIKVAIVGQIPESASDILNCMARELGRNRDIDACRLLAGASIDYLRFSNNLIAEISRASAANMVKPVILSNFLCNEVVCQIELNGKPLYADRGHLSNIGSRQLAGFFSGQLDGFAQSAHAGSAPASPHPVYSARDDLRSN
jgi:peptidoglycan/LPS O-acetylase OafA/YrhL